MIELFHFVLPAGTVHLHRTSGKDTPYFRYFSSPQGSTSVTMLQIISKVSDATWLNLVKSAGSSVLWIDYVVDWCSKMRPFSEAGKLVFYIAATKMQNYSKYLWTLWYCLLVRLIVYLKYTEESHLGFPESSDSQWIIMRQSWLNLFSVLPVGTI